MELQLLPGGAGVMTATQDCRILIHRPEDGQLALARQLIGNNDEVTDLRLLAAQASCWLTLSTYLFVLQLPASGGVCDAAVLTCRDEHAPLGNLAAHWLHIWPGPARPWGAH